MRLATVRTPAGLRLGVVLEGDLIQVATAPLTPDDVIRDGLSGQDVAALLAGIDPVPLDSVDLAPPVTRFSRDLLCTGWNYRDHFLESAGKRGGQEPVAMPDHPTFFSRAPGSVIGPRDPVAHDPELSGRYDYEAELALVIGKSGRSIPEDDAWSHVFGFLVANDVSLRDLQRQHGGQWLKGKSIDGTCPLGPWITTLDSVDVGDLRVECRLNGELMQSASTAEMAFPVPRLIAELSSGMTLHPGDVLLTGTPSGIGSAREPQVCLQDGDLIETSVSGLGVLVNRVEHRRLR